MATTLSPIQALALGMRDTAGAAIASGVVHFYQPGTTTPQTIYADAAAATPLSNPVTLNAAGQATVFTLEAVRMVVKDSTDTTTYFDYIPNIIRERGVYVTVPGINGGAETDLKTVLTTASTSFGSGFQYKVTSTGTARNVVTVLSERMVSVKDFGAVGDGVTNDYAAIQATIDYAAGLATPGGRVFFPAGTYLINTGLTNTTVGVSFEGESRALSIVKNGSATNTALSYNVGSAIDCKAFIRGLGFTASTTSSGSAIVVLNGDRVAIENVSTALHRTGIDVSSVTAARVNGCTVLSTDDNAAAVGITMGSRGKATDCEVISGTTNGTGISLFGANSRAVDCYAEKFATGISCAATNTVASACTVSSSTTGVSLAGSASAFEGRAASCTTGISVGAVASARVSATYSGNTTDLSVNNSATNFLEVSNWATLSAGTATPFVWPVRSATTYTANGTTATFTPTHQAGLWHWVKSTINAGTLTISAPAGTTKMVGDTFYLSVSDANAITIAFNAIYKGPDGSTALNTLQQAANGTPNFFAFVWDGAAYRLMASIAGIGTSNVGPFA